MGVFAGTSEENAAEIALGKTLEHVSGEAI
jgi:hypothetical protein